MKLFILIIFIVLFNNDALSQNIIYKNKNIEIHEFYIFETQIIPPYIKDNSYKNGKYIFGLLYKFINKNYFDFGIIQTTNPFPTHNSININFFLRQKITIKNIYIKYSHISNGFGFLYEINPGYDQLSVHINF